MRRAGVMAGILGLAVAALASHYQWGQCVGFDAKGRYQVRTADRGLLHFDAGTGNLIQ